jgi:signal transduction histidine kinase
MALGVKLRGLSSEKELERTAPIEGTKALTVAGTTARAKKITAHPTVAHTVETLLLEERTRWAMRIHDGLTQSVTSAVLEIHALRQRIVSEPEEAVAVLGEVEEAIRADLREIREILFELQDGPPNVDTPLARFVNDLADRWKLSAVVSVEGNLQPVTQKVMQAAQGILAEAMANVARHSGTTSVTVRVRAEREELSIVVEDRGRGIPIMAVSDKDQHFGLQMMRARAEETGGSIDIRSTPGSGTLVAAVLPVGGRGELR